MTDDRIVSARGVYYDLTKSPYGYESPYGDSFKFPSQKKLEMFTRDILKEVERIDKALSRNEMAAELPDEIILLIYRSIYRSLYRKIVEG